MAYNIPTVQVDRAALAIYLSDFDYDYDAWTDDMAKARILLLNFSKLLNRVPDQWRSELTSDPQDDARTLEAAANAISNAFVLISAGKKVNKPQLETVTEILSQSADVLDVENDNLDEILSVGLFAAYMDHQFRNIEIAAADAQTKIEALRKQLVDAKKRVRGAEIQGAVDTGIFVVMTVFAPELTVFTKVTIAAGQWAMDSYLGGDKSSPTVDNLSTANSGAGVGQQAIEDWKLLGPKAGKAVKVGGKAVAVAGLYFDANEIYSTMQDAGVIEKTLDDAIQSLRVVSALLDRTRPAMVRLKLQLIKVGQTLKASLETIKQMHDALWKTMQDINWDGGTFTWKINA